MAKERQIGRKIGQNLRRVKKDWMSQKALIFEPLRQHMAEIKEER